MTMTVRFPLLSCLSLFLTCLLAAGLRAEPADPTEFPALTAACQPLGQFLAESSVAIGDAQAAPCTPFAPDSRITALEEHADFLYAKADMSHAIPGAVDKKISFTRRVLVLRSSVFVIEDEVKGTDADVAVRWLIQARQPAQAKDDALCFTSQRQTLALQSLPIPANFTQPAESTFQVQAAANGRVRRLSVLCLSEQAGPRVTADIEQRDENLIVNAEVGERKFRLTLPGAGPNTGWISIDGGDDKPVMATRPLASGILPHGPQGVQLLERWDRAYRGGNRAPWDTGQPAGDLQQAVESGQLKPCRTVVLGCGSGTNAIYLAGKGFEVTAIDVAPTALGIAQEKADKAGVRVHWVLADVLSPPPLQPFDLIFDRGCYHNVRYVNAARFVDSMKRLSKPGTRCLILSLNRDSPPGVKEQTMREDFADGFEIKQLRESNITTGREGNQIRNSWCLLLERTSDE